MRNVLLVLLAVSALGCRERSERRFVPTGDVAPPHASADSIPNGPVQGKLDGQPFTAGEARYIVDRRAGYEHTDIQLIAGKAKDPCGPIEPEGAPRIWIRRGDAARITPGETRTVPSREGPLSVHYEAKRGGVWAGNGDAAALVSIEDVRADGVIKGSLAVCFDDAARSCAAGTFAARHCPIEIDAPVRGAALPGSPPTGAR
jgi:hypothetical protein